MEVDGRSGEDAAVLTVDLLNAAADIMDERGLAKLAYFDPDGSCCILGAIALARGYTPEETGPSVEEDHFVEEPMRELQTLMRRNPVAFSDAEWVTTSDVSDALRWAAWARHLGRDARSSLSLEDKT